MSLGALVVTFLAYSFVGWIGDTAVRSSEGKKWITGNLFPVPLCPIYGFGAIVILVLHTWLGTTPLLIQLVIMGIVLAAFEYITGVLVLRIFKRRLWHYPKSFLNVGGFTDFWHAVLWAEVSLFFIVIHPAIVHVIKTRLLGF